jgi:hypothetical protein
VSAGDEPGERPIVLDASRAPRHAALPHVLGLVPQGARHERLMDTAIRRAVPVEITGVDPVLENLVDGGDVHRVLALPEDEAGGSRLVGHFPGLTTMPTPSSGAPWT